MATNHTTSPLPTGPIVHKWIAGPCPRAILIFQHGFGEYSERYVTLCSRIIPHLNSRGFEVRGLDVIGHGRSPGLRGICSIEQAVDDHVTVRKLASADSPGLPIFMMGHSMGGLITAGSVLTYGEDVQGVILMSPAFPAKVHLMTRAIVEIAAFLVPARQIYLKPAGIEGLSRDPAIWKLALEDPMMLKQQICYRLANTALKMADRIRAKYANWKTPVLVMHGTKDTYTELEGSEEFFNNIEVADKKLRTWQDAVHELLNDLDKDQVLKEITEWLEEHLARVSKKSNS